MKLSYLPPLTLPYNIEDNPSSKFAMVEFAQIQATIAVELENNKMTWRQYFSTAANRRQIGRAHV